MSGSWNKTRMRIVAIALCIFSSWGVRGVVTAQEVAPQGGVRILASKSGSYDLEKQVFVGSGDVEISYGDLLLQGQELYLDLLTGELQLQGAVSLTQDGQEIVGQYLIYNLETGRGTFSEAQAQIPLPKDAGTIYVAGEEVSLTNESYGVKNASFTTCDLPESHYHLATKELELILGEKVIIKGVTYYEGKIPLFYWPYLVIPLDIDGDSFFTLPILGYGEREGYYMKNTFNYYFNSKSYGYLYLDLFSRLGIGVGARHYYETGTLGKGSLYLYGLPNSDEDKAIFKGAFDHELRKDSWTLRTNTTQEKSWEREELRSDNSFGLILPKLSLEAYYKYRASLRAAGKQVKKSEEYGGSWSQQLTDQLSVNVRGSFIQRQTHETLRLLDYLAEAKYRQGKHSLSLAMQQQYNPDLLKDVAQPWTTLQRTPELKWEVSDLGLERLPLRSQVLLGRYGENRSAHRDTRLLAQLTLRPMVWSPTKASRLNYQGDVATALYGTKAQQTWVYGRLTLNQKITDQLQFSSTYTHREVWGLSPFRFDTQKPLQDLGFRLSFSDPKWQASLNSSYNLKTKKFGTLILQSRWRPSAEWVWDLYANYDLNTRKLARVVPMVQYKSGEVELKLGGRYFPTSQVWDMVDGRITLPLGESWLLSYNAIYEPPKGAFSQGKITIAKDLHCRKVSLSYDHVAKRVAFQYTINAFPTLPIGWDSQGGLGLFDLSEVSEIIGGME